MARVNDGIQARADFDEALDEDGQSVVRVRESYRDEGDNWHDTRRIPCRVFIVESQPAQPYSWHDAGMVNWYNRNPKQIFFSTRDGEPWETDIVEQGGFRCVISNLNGIIVDDELVCYQGEIVRGEKIPKVPR